MKSINSIIILILALTFFSCTPSKTILIDGQKVTQTKGFLFNTESYKADEIIKNGKLNPSIIEEVTLTKRQATLVYEIINADTRFIEGKAPIPPATCFFPRHGIVFYDQFENPLMALSLCFECYRCIASPRMKIENIYALQLIEEIIRETELPVFKKLEQYQEYKTRKFSNR